ncbi:nitrile hydratase accessory protein [Gordonia sp. TBRC 11910]|uniref:Nitrile hydratase accessory protein n=1 Tax=Gordonia asplenii TaxID=2725283 RepID=A0A848L2U5_9ACTN|nr:nitrile hydratase accessory protein [Gordonia asplenii]NMO02871.1 nitrile hydratase accessory protein [Gordonia asplenii]
MSGFVTVVDSTTSDWVQDLVCTLPGGRPGEQSFEKPWEIRAFALAVAGHQAGHYDWTTFQSALIDDIARWEANHSTAAPMLADPDWSYYEHWVHALETVLAQSDSIDPATLRERTDEVLATPPNRNHHHAVLEPVAIDPAQPVNPGA